MRHLWAYAAGRPATESMLHAKHALPCLCRTNHILIALPQVADFNMGRFLGGGSSAARCSAREINPRWRVRSSASLMQIAKLPSCLASIALCSATAAAAACLPASLACQLASQLLAGGSLHARALHQPSCKVCLPLIPPAWAMPVQAPEVLDGGPCSQASDVFAFGTVLHEVRQGPCGDLQAP